MLPDRILSYDTWWQWYEELEW